MNGDVDFVTVYRSADLDADTDAVVVQRHLVGHGLDAVILDDSAPGVVSGTREVRVPTSQAAQAELLVANFDPEARLDADPSTDLDMVTIVRRMGATAEMEAIGIKSVLDAAGIPAFIIGQSTLPNLSFHVRVPKNHVDEAKAILAEAEAAGPAAAVEAERQSENTAEIRPPSDV
jgi:Putative prokaryotic signal transducing protein